DPGHLFARVQRDHELERSGCRQAAVRRPGDDRESAAAIGRGEGGMKGFLSWSGKTSREVAQAFHDWLPFVIQAVKPFISTGDIDKGKRWSDVLSTELNETAYGILIITPDNFDKPWIHFEAGAISKAVDKAFVSPFLFNIDPLRIVGPLSQFQATVNEPDDILRLLSSINRRLPDDQRLVFGVVNRETALSAPG